jgi:hypothetical protein
MADTSRTNFGGHTCVLQSSTGREGWVSGLQDMRWCLPISWLVYLVEGNDNRAIEQWGKALCFADA